MAEYWESIQLSILVPGEEARTKAPRPVKRGRQNNTAISHVDDDDSEEDFLIHETRCHLNIFDDDVGNRGQTPTDDGKNSDLKEEIWTMEPCRLCS